MTHTEKEEIKARRVAGQSYAAIADALGLRKDQVSAFCRRYIQKDICLNCGKPLTQIKGRKPIKFCNADCRTGWWNSHPSAVHRKAYYNFICKCCGKEFRQHRTKIVVQIYSPSINYVHIFVRCNKNFAGILTYVKKFLRKMAKIGE
ncbi:MAG: RNA polymerase subunit sigma-70 [Ruminococcus sp.]|nr:RNA polymerase subunit sigma-70 [Ruminococcus sp.]